MAVINLGQVARRESPLSGLSSALGQGMEMGMNVNVLKQRERERKTREKADENALSSKLADQELRKREQDIKNVRSTHEQFSMWWNGMNAQEKSIAQTSDQYKEMQKFFKSFNSLVPGLVKDNGEIIASTSKDIYSRKLEERSAQATLNLSTGNASAEDIQLLKLKSADTEMLASALAEATEKLNNTDVKDPQMFKAAVAKVLESYKGTGDAQSTMSLRQGLAQPQGRQITQPIAPVNPNTAGLADPLGAFK